MRVIVLFFDTPPARAPMVAELRRGLQAIGWVEGRDVGLEVLYAMSSQPRLDELAQQAVASRPDAIVVAGTLPAVAAHRATREIPLVMVGVGDPLARGLIASFERPGGNVTGSSDQAEDAIGRRFDFIERLVGRPVHVGIVGGVRFVDTAGHEAEARSRGWRLRFVDTPPGQNMVALMAGAALAEFDAIFVVPSPVSFAARARVAELCLAQRVPLLVGWREFMDVPAPAGCGPNLTRLYAEVGAVLSRLRAGEPAGAIPVVRPRFQRWLRPQVLRRLGKTIDARLLDEVDEVIDG
jgi:putative ABC transport system substrate-binding protein